MVKRIRILLIGSEGYIGSRFNEMLNDKYNIDAPSMDALDITDESSVNKYIGKSKVSIIINLSGRGDIDDCEINSQETSKINVLGVRHLALACKKYKKKLIQLSSTSAEFQKSEYGKEKFVADMTIADIFSEYLILRSDKVYNDIKPFVSITQNKIACYSNIYHPVFLDDLICIIDESIAKNLYGIINISSSTGIDKIRWAYMYIKSLNLDKIKIVDLGYNSLRPKNSKVSTVRLYKNELTIPRTFEDGIKTIKARIKQ